MRHEVWRRIGLVLALLCVPMRIGAQEPPAARDPHRWGSLTLFHGLPSDRVRAIAQTADGTLWFGTDAGLARFDGRRIHATAFDGLPGGGIRVLTLDSGGTLWIGTETGAARLVGDHCLPISETSGHAIAAIVTAPDRTFIASGDGMIFSCRVDPVGRIKTDRAVQDPLLTAPSSAAGNPPASFVTSLAVVRETVLVGTRGRGLLAVENGVVRETALRPRPFFIAAVVPSPTSGIWLGAEDGTDDSGLFFLPDPDHSVKLGEQLGTVTGFAFDADGDVWAGTTRRGIVHLRDRKVVEHFTFDRSAGGLRSDRIYTIFADREGVLWFGTDRGACRYDPRGPRTDLPGVDGESNFVRTVATARNGTIWCGTNRGLFFRQSDFDSWTGVAEFSGRVIHSMFEDADGRLIVGTANGLYTVAGAPPFQIAAVEKDHLDGETGDSIRAIAPFQGKIYVASFGRGLERLDGPRRVLVHPCADPVSLFADGDRLWIGTAQNGVLRFDGNAVSPAMEFGPIQAGGVWSMLRTPRGFWLASTRGLYCLTDGKLVPVREGVDARGLLAARLPDGRMRLWCATAGAGLFSIAEDEPTLVGRLTTENGLPSDNLFALVQTQTPAGEPILWIGSSRGLTRYQPGGVPPVLTVARAVGRRVYRDDDVRNGIALDYPQNNLVVEVAATSSRTFPEAFQYRFQLFDSTGKIVRERLARDAQLATESLASGNYRIVVQAYTNDLAASAPVEVRFFVARAPFPWTTVLLAVSLATALAVLWWMYRQSRRIARANALLAETRLQLATETENERRRIARDLHDQTLADLRRLLLLSDELPSGFVRRDQLTPAGFRREIEAISTEIRRICEDLSPSVLSNIGLTAALEWLLSTTVACLPERDRFTYRFVADDHIDERLTPEEQIQMYRVVQEAVNNVCRHAGARAVTLTAAIEPDGAFVVTLEDDGRGFATGTATGRGLANIRSRASLIHAEADWSPRPGGGTRFTLRQPDRR